MLDIPQFYIICTTFLCVQDIIIVDEASLFRNLAVNEKSRIVICAYFKAYLTAPRSLELRSPDGRHIIGNHTITDFGTVSPSVVYPFIMTCIRRHTFPTGILEIFH